MLNVVSQNTDRAKCLNIKVHCSHWKVYNYSHTYIGTRYINKIRCNVLFRVFFFFICILNEILVVVIEHDLKENQRYRYMLIREIREKEKNFIDKYSYNFVNKI